MIAQKTNESSMIELGTIVRSTAHSVAWSFFRANGSQGIRLQGERVDPFRWTSSSCEGCTQQVNRFDASQLVCVPGKESAHVLANLLMCEHEGWRAGDAVDEPRAHERGDTGSEVVRPVWSRRTEEISVQIRREWRPRSRPKARVRIGGDGWVAWSLPWDVVLAECHFVSVDSSIHVLHPALKLRSALLILF